MKPVPGDDGSLSNSDDTSIKFSEMPWSDVGPFVREKRVTRGGHVIRMVEFQQGFEEDGWCERGHVGYVTKGTLELRFENDSIVVSEGDAIWIPGGTESRHRAFVIGDLVHLVLFESETSESP